MRWIRTRCIEMGALLFVLSGCGLGDEGTMLFRPAPAPAPADTASGKPGAGIGNVGNGLPQGGTGTGTVATDAGAPPAVDSGTSTDAGTAPDVVKVSAPPPPTTLAQNFGGGEFVAVDPMHAYWTTGAGNAVMSCPLSGCAAGVTTLGSGMTTFGITVDTANVYWTDYGDGLACECPLAGCDGTTILEGQGVRGDGIFVAEDSIFWTFATDQSLAAGTGALFMSATDGTGTTPLVTQQNFPAGVTVGAGQIYWAVYGDGVIRTCAWNNCAQTVKELVSAQSGPSYLAVDASHVYWTNAGTSPNFENGSVMQANLDGSQVVTLAGSLPSPRGIAIDSASVYFTNYVSPTATSGTVMRCAIGGCSGSPTTLASGQASPVGVTVDASNVYWVDEGGGGALMMTPK